MHPPTLQFEVGVGDGVKNFRKVFAGGQKFLFILVGRVGLIIGGSRNFKEKFTLRELEIPINMFYHVYHIKIFSFPLFIFQAL